MKSESELLSKWLMSPCKNGLKIIPLSPETVRGNIPKFERFTLKISSVKKTIQISITNSVGTIQTEGVNLKNEVSFIVIALVLVWNQKLAQINFYAILS